MNETVMINDIKKGATVRLFDGRDVVVADNKKGMIRMITCDVIGFEPMQETGSIYAYEWAFVKVEGDWIEVSMTPAQHRQARIVQFSMRNW